MAVTLTPQVQDQLEDQYLILPLVLFELPGLVRGYYGGPYDYNYNGQTYQPNRFLSVEDLVETLDNDIGERIMEFSGIPVDGDDLINDFLDLNYTGSRVTLTKLILNPETYEEVGLAEVNFYEIYDASITETPESEDITTLTVEIILRAPGFIGRRQTNTVRSVLEHQRDFDPTDTFYEHITETRTIQREWGQRNG